MKRCDVYTTIHAMNYGALYIAICREEPTTVDDAFLLYEEGTLKGRGHGLDRGELGRQRIRDMTALREEGCTWPEIGEILGLKAPLSYYSHHKHLVGEEKREHGREDRRNKYGQEM